MVSWSRSNSIKSTVAMHLVWVLGALLAGRQPLEGNLCIPNYRSTSSPEVSILLGMYNNSHRKTELTDGSQNNTVVHDLFMSFVHLQ